MRVREKQTFDELGESVAPVRVHLLDYMRHNKVSKYRLFPFDPIHPKNYSVHNFEGSDYGNGIDLKTIVIRAGTKVEAVIKWLDWRNANVRYPHVSDAYEGLQESYDEEIGDGKTEKEALKYVVDGMFENETEWLKELKDRTIVI